MMYYERGERWKLDKYPPSPSHGEALHEPDCTGLIGFHCPGTLQLNAKCEQYASSTATQDPLELRPLTFEL